MASLTRTKFDSSGIDLGFRAERNQSLHRVLRRLPYDFIVALIEGLERADEIVPGRLFAGRHGGCAVGVTLRTLEPGYRGRRLVWGRRARKSVTALRRDIAKEVSHLHALEEVFDRSVHLAQQRFATWPERQVAKAVAMWVADEARTELVLREMDSDWLDRLSREREAFKRGQTLFRERLASVDVLPHRESAASFRLCFA